MHTLIFNNFSKQIAIATLYVAAPVGLRRAGRNTRKRGSPQRCIQAVGSRSSSGQAGLWLSRETRAARAVRPVAASSFTSHVRVVCYDTVSEFALYLQSKVHALVKKTIGRVVRIIQYMNSLNLICPEFIPHTIEMERIAVII